MNVLTFNVGSSSLKAALYEGWSPRPRVALDVDLPSGRIQAAQGLPDGFREGEGGAAAMVVADRLLAALEQSGTGVDVCGHRVVHGGDRDAPAKVDEALMEEMERRAPLCPLHQPPALAVVAGLRRLRPDLLQVAAFDTAFHAAQPPLWREFALPAGLRQQGIRSYGFHGLSCQSIMRQLAEKDPDMASGRLIIAHLGNGSSLTAVLEGKSQATTMAFSALEGVPMGTRCGRLDPGVLLYLLEQGWDLPRLNRLLYRESGLLGLSGIASDMRVLMRSGTPEAGFAIDYFIDRVAREAASLATVLGGLDGLVFTGGIGEHQPAIRAGVASRLAWMGVAIDSRANEEGVERITAPDSRVDIRVMVTDEQDELRRAALRIATGLPHPHPCHKDDNRP